MAQQKRAKREYGPNEKMTSSLSLLKRQWDSLQDRAKKEGISMSAYVVQKLKL